MAQHPLVSMEEEGLIRQMHRFGGLSKQPLYVLHSVPRGAVRALAGAEQGRLIPRGDVAAFVVSS